MASETQKRSRLTVLFFLGIILFHYPILSLFSDADKEIFGIPLLFAYVFTTWALLIGLTFVIVMRRKSQDSHSEDEVD